MTIGSADTPAQQIAGGYLTTGRRSNWVPWWWTGPSTRSAQVRIPLAMMNRHGLVAGATGTRQETKTLQVIAEQLSAAGVPVMMADVRVISLAC